MGSIRKLVESVRTPWLESPRVRSRVTKIKRIFVAVFLCLAIPWLYYAWQVEPKHVTLDTRQFRLERLPKPLDGLRIVQLSDLHMSRYGDVEHQAVKMTMSLHPDMIVLTGDYVGGRFVRKTATRLAELQKMLRDLHAPLGVWAILGNNEGPAIYPWMTQCGVRPLDNRSTYVKIRGTGLWLVGVAYPGGIREMTLAFAGLPQQGPKLLLAHTPDTGETIPYLAAGADGALFGHTHGGQVYFPGIGPLYLPTHGKFPRCGQYRVAKTNAYITQGIGCNWFPLRFMCPPQVSLMILRSGISKTQ